MALGIEVLLIKLGCYILTVGEELHALDFMALAGYKFCIMIASTAAGQFGTLAKYSAFLYCSVAYGMFLVNQTRSKSSFLTSRVDPFIKTNVCARRCKCSSCEPKAASDQFLAECHGDGALNFVYSFKVKAGCLHLYCVSIRSRRTRSLEQPAAC
jgi:hypothetical protein